jgi:alkylation response protein AidB-like acyl-CoA dehydrogenase
MDFDLSQDLLALQDSVKRFVEETVLPQIMTYEEQSVFPRDIFKEAGRRGFLRAHTPTAEGGGGLGTMAFCVVSEELAKAGFGMTHNGHFQTQKMLVEYGSQGQRRMFLEKLLTGEYLAATAITEPEVGSSFAAMQTRIEKSGDDYVLNGVKTLINDAAEADIINIFAREENRGISVFLLEKGTKGFRILKKLDPMGMRSSPIYEFELKDCTVTAAQRIGDAGAGLKTFFSAFNFSRLGNASAALGIAQAAFDKTVAYVRQRHVGKRIAAEFQGLRWKLADLDTLLESARLLRNRAAVMEEQGGDISLESSRAKLYCVETANRVVGECIQATGRYGCMRESLFDLYLRDARVIGTAGGSLEVMRNNVARPLFGD